MEYKHTCHELGVCQNRYLHCHGCVKPGNVSTAKKPAKNDTVSLLKKRAKKMGAEAPAVKRLPS